MAGFLDNDLVFLIEELDQRLTQAIGEIDSHQEKKPFSGCSCDPSLDFLETDSRLALLVRYFRLSALDLFIIALALAPELDRKYEYIYTYLQNDVTANFPSVDLVLNLFSTNLEEKISNRRHFSPLSPLLRHRLITLTPPNSKATFLTHYITLDGSIVRYLLQQPGLDQHLTSFCHLDDFSTSPQIEIKHPLFTSFLQLIQQDFSAVFYFQGVNQFDKRQFISALAQALSIPVLTVNLEILIEKKEQIQEYLSMIFREAFFIPALLYLESIESFWTETQEAEYHSLLGLIKNSQQVITESQKAENTDALKSIKNRQLIIIISGHSPWNFTLNQEIEIISIAFDKPSFEQQKTTWIKKLEEAQITLEETEINILCDRFSLHPEQITNIVNIATAQSQLYHQGNPPQLKDLISITRQQFSQKLTHLAKKVNPKASWDDLILPPVQKTLLRRICQEYEKRQLVYYQWEFAAKSSQGIGLNVLFSGLPGTGKTMAAEVIADHLQLDLYKIDLSQIVSKYIGETEKNLNRIFEAAAAAMGILFFDEADALFGKRSEVKDAHDRYANIEIGYLLQKMEEYQGIAILTTNLRNNLDPAFERRLRYIIEFPLPDIDHRLEIWQRIFPKKAPISDDIDWSFLAEKFELTGADIRNIALSSAFLAAQGSQEIAMQHIVSAIRQEYRKTGRILRSGDLGKFDIPADVSR